MGIDAAMLIRYRGERPTDDQLTRWSWDLCRAVGAKKFFISDGLPPDDYQQASDAWHKAFNSHPEYATYKNAGEDRAKWDVARQKIVASIGEYPKDLRRAVELTSRRYPLDSESSVPEAWRAPGMAWTQDGPEILAEPGETFLEVSLWSRYYGVGYERGDLLTICAVAEWIEANMQPCEVWYGGDSSGVLAERFDAPAREKLRQHLYSLSGRNYFSSWGTPPRAMPEPCGLCVPGENRLQQYGTGSNGEYAAVSCAGCGKNFVTRDSGATWSEKEEDE